MPVTIENQTGTRVLLRLNSGRNWHLGPGEALEVEPVARIRRLEERRVISVERPQAASAEPEEKEAAARAPRRVRGERPST